jgi:hypothetical protein
MKIKFKQNYSDFMLRRSSGSVLLDVLLGIVIFVIGMLALASLQGNLTRSSADANARTVGANIAEELIEQLRVFRRLDKPAPDYVCETDLNDIDDENVYECILDSSTSVTRSGIEYTVAATIEDWYFMPDSVSITKDTGDLPSSQDTAISDFKYMELDVSWTGVSFQGADDQNSDGRLGSGAFTVSSIIPSVAQLGSAQVAADDDGALGTPPINYTPGPRPDIVAIDLDGGQYKESRTPVPDVIRADELVETWFDVITYNTANNTVFLRREEFVVLTCECTLHSNPNTPSGFLPTIWNGVEYVTGTDGEMVAKAYGTSANNQQSQYCDTCCRDHHDPDEASPGNDKVYDPARLNKTPAWSESGGLDRDHMHYTRANKGSLSEATNNQIYVEACRMVRKDGFMRVAQDFRQEGFHSFPEGFLDTLAGVESYSDYVTEAVADFYDQARDELLLAGELGYDFPGDRLTSANGVEEVARTDDTTELPLLGLYSQQMSSRGIYIDYQSAELDALLDCLELNAAEAVPGDICGAPGVDDPLQVLPFYDVQTTWLAWWNSARGDMVSVTSESVNDNNTHSRGLAEQEDYTVSTVIAIDNNMHRGNIGLTVTDPITLADSAPTSQAMSMLYVDINGGGDGVPPGQYVWEGVFGSSVNKVESADADIMEGDYTFCSRSGTSLSCATADGQPGSITITGYSKKQGQTDIPLWICASGTPFPAGTEIVNDPNGINNSVTITWPPMGHLTGVVLSIEDAECPTPDP